MMDMLLAITRGLVLLVVILALVSTLAGLAGAADDAPVALPADKPLTLDDCTHHSQACT